MHYEANNTDKGQLHHNDSFALDPGWKYSVSEFSGWLMEMDRNEQAGWVSV